MSAVQIRVLGIPAPQGSKRAFVRNGRAVLTESAGDKHKAWRIAVAETCHDKWGAQQPLDCPLHVIACFYMPRPKSAGKRLWNDKRPDLDKLLRSTLDGLTDSGMIADDARISKITAEKVYTIAGWTGADITVQTLEVAA